MNKLIALFAFLILAGCAGRTTVEKIVTVTETDTVLVDCLMVGGIVPVKICSLIGDVVVVLTDCETPCADVLDQMPDGCYVGELSLPEGTDVEFATLCPFDENQPLLEGPHFLVVGEETCPLVEDRFVPCDSLDGRVICTDGSEVEDRSECPSPPPSILSVRLAAFTPPSQTVLPGAASVRFIIVEFEQTGPSRPIEKLTFSLDGVGNLSNVESAFLYRLDGESPFRSSDAAAFDPDTREVTFDTDLIVEEGFPVYLAVHMDVADEVIAGDALHVTLVSVESEDQEVVGEFPIQGNTTVFSDNLELGTVTIGKFSIFQPVEGDPEGTLASFSARATGEGAFLKALTLHSPQALDRSDYSLWADTPLGEVTRLVDCAAFSQELILCPDIQLYLEQDEFYHLELRAGDFGQAGDVTQVAIEEKADVIAFGDAFGFNMAVDITAYDDAGASCAPVSRCTYTLVSDGCGGYRQDIGGSFVQSDSSPSFFPSGDVATRAVLPGPNVAMQFEAFAQGSCGADVTLSWISSFSVRATDEDGTGWVEGLHDNAPDLIRLVNLTTGVETPATTVSFLPTGHLGTTTFFDFGFDFDPDEILASGERWDYEIIVDTSGASMDSNDSIELSTMFEALWSDGTNTFLTSNLGSHIGTVLIH